MEGNEEEPLPLSFPLPPIEESLTQYDAFCIQKKRRKKIEKLLPENWEMGMDKRLFKKKIEQKSSFKRRKISPGSTKNKRKNEMSEKFQNDFFDESMKNENPKQVISIKESQMKKYIDEENEITSCYKTRPLEEWMEMFASTKNAKPILQLKKEIETSMANTIIKNTTKNKEQKVRTDLMSEKRKLPCIRKRKREEEKDQEKDKFFIDDNNSEIFGLENASSYQIFSDLEKEQKERQRIFDVSADVLKECNSSLKIDFEKIEKCTRAYCEDFLREPKDKEGKYGERFCKRGEYCICYLMATRYPDPIENVKPQDGFICREFLLPSELENWKKSKFLPEQEQLCLVCNRLFTTFWYYLYRWKNEEPVEIIQNHFYLIDEDGEYDLSCCIYPNPTDDTWTGIVRPFIKFRKNSYVYTKCDLKGEKTQKILTLKCVKETHMDFR